MDEAERCSRVGYIHDSRLMAVGTPAELKALPVVDPPGTRRLEIRVRDSSATLERLRRVPGVREATIFGQVIRALVDEGAGAADLGLDPAAVLPSEAGLEDVFIALARERTR
jgi:ABC-type multidrug transport system ATPase subunit